MFETAFSCLATSLFSMAMWMYPVESPRGGGGGGGEASHIQVTGVLVEHFEKTP